jgi:hypothetical protein
MAIEYLVIISYGFATLYLMALIAGIGAVTVLRRTRLDKQQIAASNRAALRQKLYMIHSPLDDVQTWSSKATQISAKISGTTTSSPTELPIRYQQTRLYRDNPPNPQNEVETKPLVIP